MIATHANDASDPDLELDRAEPRLGVSPADRADQVRPVERLFRVHRCEKAPPDRGDVVRRSDEVLFLFSPL